MVGIPYPLQGNRRRIFTLIAVKFEHLLPKGLLQPFIGHPDIEAAPEFFPVPAVRLQEDFRPRKIVKHKGASFLRHRFFLRLRPGPDADRQTQPFLSCLLKGLPRSIQHSTPVAAKVLADNKAALLFRLDARLIIPVFKRPETGRIQIPAQCLHFQGTGSLSLQLNHKDIDAGIQIDPSLRLPIPFHFQGKKRFRLFQIRFRPEAGNRSRKLQLHRQGRQLRPAYMLFKNIRLLHISGIPLQVLLFMLQDL